jgi:EpsI family protein
MRIRAVIVSLCLVAASVLIARASRVESVPPRESFATFPQEIGSWNGVDEPQLDAQVLAQLRVDEYVNRLYSANAGAAGIGFYLGYYRTQREGQTMHSPLNCMPGAGWEPVRKQHLAIQVQDTIPSASSPARSIVVNRLTIQKGADKQVVLYWYQSRGRVVASEYWGKVYTVVDAIRTNRTDAAMIRIIAPVAGSDAGAETTAERQVVQFAQAVFPLLGRYLPS